MKSWMLGLALTGMVPGGAVANMPAFAPDASGTALMQRSEKQTKSAREATVYRMALLDAEGHLVQARTMRLYFRHEEVAGGVLESTLIKFDAPPALAGTGLLVADKGEAANDLWLYLPATRRLRRLAGAEKTNWFLGTEFTHEDFEDYKIEHYAFAAPRESDCGARRCWVVEARPASASERAASGYAAKVYWLDKESLYPVTIEYMSRDGVAGKRLETRGLGKVGPYWRPTEYAMQNLANGRRTVLTVEQRELDGELDAFYTSQRFLRGE